MNLPTPPTAVATPCPGFEVSVGRGVLILTMGHKPTRNSFDDVRSRTLEAIVSTLESRSEGQERASWDGQPVRVLALASACPPVWASGGDLKEIAAQPAVSHATMARMRGIAKRLKVLPCMSIALLNGAAIGGAAELALACDERWITGPAAGLELRQRDWGLPAGWDGLRSLVTASRGTLPERSAALAFVRGQSWTADGLLQARLAAEDFRERTDDVQPALEALAADMALCPRELVEAYLSSPGAEPDFDRFWLGAAHRAALVARTPQSGTRQSTGEAQ